jgi:hypothetical protein
MSDYKINNRIEVSMVSHTSMGPNPNVLALLMPLLLVLAHQTTAALAGLALVFLAVPFVLKDVLGHK